MTKQQKELMALIDKMNAEQGYCRTPDIAQALGITTRTAYERLHRLVKRNLIIYEQSTLPQLGSLIDYYWLPGKKPTP